MDVLSYSWRKYQAKNVFTKTEPSIIIRPTALEQAYIIRTRLCYASPPHCPASQRFRFQSLDTWQAKLETGFDDGIRSEINTELGLVGNVAVTDHKVKSTKCTYHTHVNKSTRSGPEGYARPPVSWAVWIRDQLVACCFSFPIRASF